MTLSYSLTSTEPVTPNKQQLLKNLEKKHILIKEDSEQKYILFLLLLTLHTVNHDYQLSVNGYCGFKIEFKLMSL